MTSRKEALLGINFFLMLITLYFSIHLNLIDGGGNAFLGYFGLPLVLSKFVIITFSFVLYQAIYWFYDKKNPESTILHDSLFCIILVLSLFFFTYLYKIINLYFGDLFGDISLFITFTLAAIFYLCLLGLYTNYISLISFLTVLFVWLLNAIGFQFKTAYWQSEFGYHTSIEIILVVSCYLIGIHFFPFLKKLSYLEQKSHNRILTGFYFSIAGMFLFLFFGSQNTPWYQSVFLAVLFLFKIIAVSLTYSWLKTDGIKRHKHVYYLGLSVNIFSFFFAAITTAYWLANIFIINSCVFGYYLYYIYHTKTNEKVIDSNG